MSSGDACDVTATVGAMETGVDSSMGQEEAIKAEGDKEEENLKAAFEVEAKPTSTKKVHPLFGRLSCFCVCFKS